MNGRNEPRPFSNKDNVVKNFPWFGPLSITFYATFHFTFYSNLIYLLYRSIPCFIYLEVILIYFIFVKTFSSKKKILLNFVINNLYSKYLDDFDIWRIQNRIESASGLIMRFRINNWATEANRTQETKYRVKIFFRVPQGFISSTRLFIACPIDTITSKIHLLHNFSTLFNTSSYRNYY